MSGSPDSFEQVLGPIVSHGYALAFTMLNDRGAAEDAVQNAAVKTWRKLATLHDRPALEPWFLAIALRHRPSPRRRMTARAVG